MLNAYKEFWCRYVDFEGRSKLDKFWWAVLANMIINAVLAFINPSLTGLYSLATFLPGIAMIIRRLNDVGKGAWNILWVFLPLIGWIILVFYLLRKTNTYNKFIR